MSSKYWKTRTGFPRRPEVSRPSLPEILRQVAIVGLVVAIWGVILVGYLQLIDDQSEQVMNGQPEPTTVALVPTDTPTPVPSDTPIPTDSPTPTTAPATLTQESTLPPSTAPGDASTVEPSPSPAPSATPSMTPSPTPMPTPTDTASPPTDTPVPVDDASLVSFSQDVLPILQNRCVKCHGGEKTEEGLVLSAYADVIAGSWNGPVIEPGNAAESFLIEQIVSGEMPKRAPRLLPAQIRTITEWVDAGAPDN